MKSKVLISLLATVPFSLMAQGSIEHNWSSDTAGGPISQVSDPVFSKDTVYYFSGDSMYGTDRLSIDTGNSVNNFDYDFSNEIRSSANTTTKFLVKRDDDGAEELRGESFNNYYQTFGIWNTGRGTTSGNIGAYSHHGSYGPAMSAADIPKSGKALFTGTSLANYVDPNGTLFVAISDSNINVDFSKRTVNFNTSATDIHALTDPASVNTRRDDLNLSGTLTWDQGANAFSGAINTSDARLNGSANGSFYGYSGDYYSSISEVGGTFSASAKTGPETLVGAFGATK